MLNVSIITYDRQIGNRKLHKIKALLMSYPAEKEKLPLRLT